SGVTRLLVLLLAAAALGGCQRMAHATHPPLAQLEPPLKAAGHGPAWTARLDATGMTLSRPGTVDIVAPAKLVARTSDSARWEGRTADGRALEFAVVTRGCIEPGPDRPERLGAEVRLDGEILKGCAERAAH